MVVGPACSSSLVWCGILFQGVSLLHWKHHFIFLVHILLCWIICVSSHLWVLHDAGPQHLRPWSLSFGVSCLGVFMLIAFRCTCTFGCCINLGWVIFGLCMYPSFLAVSLPMIRYPLVSMTWNMAFLGTWHQVRSTALHNPAVVTIESPYVVIILIGNSGLWSPKIDL